MHQWLSSCAQGSASKPTCGKVPGPLLELTHSHLLSPALLDQMTPSIFKRSFFLWYSPVSVVSLFADLWQDYYYPRFTRQRVPFEEGKGLSSSPSRDRDLAPLWLRILALRQYLVALLFICWNIALLRRANICSSLISVLGYERKVAITASYQGSKRHLSTAGLFFLNANLFFCLDCWKYCVCVCSCSVTCADGGPD